MLKQNVSRQDLDSLLLQRSSSNLDHRTAQTSTQHESDQSVGYRQITDPGSRATESVSTLRCPPARRLAELIRRLVRSTRELRLRDQLVAEREKDLLSRESSVLQREQSVLSRENALRSLSDQIKDREIKVMEGERKLSEAIQTQRALAMADRENQRPIHVMTGYGGGGNGSPSLDHEVVARVASRPSLVPRRPLDERRAR